MRSQIKVDIIPMESPKCPRCYDRNGVADNFMGMCDRCCEICLEIADDLVEAGRFTPEQRDELVTGINSCRKAQIEKYKA